MSHNLLDKVAEDIKNIFLTTDLNSFNDYKVVSMGGNNSGISLEIDFKENISEVHQPVEITITLKK